MDIEKKIRKLLALSESPNVMKNKKTTACLRTRKNI